LLPDGTLNIGVLGGRKSSLKLDLRSRREIPLLLKFYHGDAKKAVAEHLRDLRTCSGLATVYSQGGDILALAGYPDCLVEPFDDLNCWLKSPSAETTTSNGSARISAANDPASITTAVFRDFRDDTDLRGRIRALSDGAMVRINITDLEKRPFIRSCRNS